MGRLAFATNWGNAHPPSIEAAAMIADVAPGDLSEVFFVSSGSEAVESAIKFARNYHLSRGDEGRYKVISRNWAYHGTTLGALAVTGIPKFRDPFLPNLWDGVRHVPNTRQCTSPAGTPADELSCVRAIEETILAEGPETVAMVIAEPIQNGGGALVPSDGYWQELRRICDRHGVLLVADEVICSFGRFGHWFASERMGVVPDMITFAKGVTSAYQPLGGVAIRGQLVQAVHDSPMGSYVHGSTFGGHPVATAVAVANMTAMRDEGVMEHVLVNEAGMAESPINNLKRACTCSLRHNVSHNDDESSLTTMTMSGLTSTRSVRPICATWSNPTRLSPSSTAPRPTRASWSTCSSTRPAWPSRSTSWPTPTRA